MARNILDKIDNLDFYDCVPFTRSAYKYGYKCPTSLKPNMTIKEYALCKTNITDPKTQAELGKKAGVDVPKKVQYKMKKKSVKKSSPPKSATNSKKRDIWGVNYVLVNGNKKKYKKDKAIAPGKCVFPFKYKRKEFNECFSVKDGDGTHSMCATKVKNLHGSWETLGYCLPEGVTPEQYDDMLKGKTQSGGGKDITAVNYRTNIDGTKKVSRSKKVVGGKCVFPFKHKRKVFNDCADSDDKTFKYCATKVNSNGIGNIWILPT